MILMSIYEVSDTTKETHKTRYVPLKMTADRAKLFLNSLYGVSHAYTSYFKEIYLGEQGEAEPPRPAEFTMVSYPDPEQPGFECADTDSTCCDSAELEGPRMRLKLLARYE